MGKIKNIIINGGGADWTESIVEGAKEIFKLDMVHIQKKKYMAVSDEEYLRNNKRGLLRFGYKGYMQEQIEANQ